MSPQLFRVRRFRPAVWADRTGGFNEALLNPLSKQRHTGDVVSPLLLGCSIHRRRYRQPESIYPASRYPVVGRCEYQETGRAEREQSLIRLDECSVAQWWSARLTNVIVAAIPESNRDTR